MVFEKILVAPTTSTNERIGATISTGTISLSNDATMSVPFTILGDRSIVTEVQGILSTPFEETPLNLTQNVNSSNAPMVNTPSNNNVASTSSTNAMNAEELIQNTDVKPVLNAESSIESLIHDLTSDDIPVAGTSKTTVKNVTWHVPVSSNDPEKTNVPKSASLNNLNESDVKSSNSCLGIGK